MTALGLARSIPTPAFTRLSALAPLSDRENAALASATASARPVRQRSELLTEGRPVPETVLIVAGWAARVRILADGRRQFLSFLLPGDLVGLCRQPRPLAVSTVVALTDMEVCRCPPAPQGSGLGDAYGVSQALEEAYLLCQVTRLGRFNAEERIGDLLLELHERLSLAGLAGKSGFDMPLTQETLADALGLTSVHLNRTLQTMRRGGDVDWKGRRLVLHDPAALARKVGRSPVRVTA